MAETVYGLDADGVRRTAETNRRVLGRRPDTGRRTRKVYPDGGSIVRFTISTLAAAGPPVVELTGTVDAVLFGHSSPGTTVTLVDALGCLTLAVGLKGYAALMVPISTSAAQWEIIAICCE